MVKAMPWTASPFTAPPTLSSRIDGRCDFVKIGGGVGERADEGEDEDEDEDAGAPDVRGGRVLAGRLLGRLPAGARALPGDGRELLAEGRELPAEGRALLGRAPLGRALLGEGRPLSARLPPIGRPSTVRLPVDADIVSGSTRSSSRARRASGEMSRRPVGFSSAAKRPSRLSLDFEGARAPSPGKRFVSTCVTSIGVRDDDGSRTESGEASISMRSTRPSTGGLLSVRTTFTGGATGGALGVGSPRSDGGALSSDRV